MIPFSDGVRVQRFPLVNAGLIAANFAVIRVLRIAGPQRGDQPRVVLSVTNHDAGGPTVREIDCY
jgi:hypothetical protein